MESKNKTIEAIIKAVKHANPENDAEDDKTDLQRSIGDLLDTYANQVTKELQEELYEEKNNLALLRANYEATMKPTRSITLQIPQTKRPSDLLSPDDVEDCISVKTMRPCSDDSLEDIKLKECDKKIERLNGLLQGLTVKRDEYHSKRLLNPKDYEP